MFAKRSGLILAALVTAILNNAGIEKALAQTDAAQEGSNLELFDETRTSLEVVHITARCSLIFGLSDPSMVHQNTLGTSARI